MYDVITESPFYGAVKADHVTTIYEDVVDELLIGAFIEVGSVCMYGLDVLSDEIKLQPLLFCA